MSFIKKYWYLLFLVLPFLFAYSSFFTKNPLTFGDAPYYHLANLSETFNLPFIWNYTRDNFGATQGHILWLYLPNLLVGSLGTIFNISSELLVRIVFYFPATILSIIGSWFFLKKFTDNKLSLVLGSFLYGFNGYFLLLVDGGQVGVALAYGIFPFATGALLNFFEKNNLRNFLITLIVFFVLSNVDVRIFLLAWFLGFWLILINYGLKIPKQKLISFMALVLSWFGLNLFWLWPAFSNNAILSGVNLLNNGTGFITLLDSFLLYQPHFPLNEFGRILPPPFYYAFLPALLFLWLVFKKENSKKYLFSGILFLLLIFLAKGDNEPLGEFYNFIVNYLPFGILFRDSSKFYIPALLIGSLLLTFGLDEVKNRIKNVKLYYGVFFAVFIYLCILIYPAFTHQLTGNLGLNYPDFSKVNYLITSNSVFFRTLWFKERPEIVVSSWEKPAISAQNLYLEIPFASMIVGDYDLYYFLHNSLFPDWLRLLGIKYVFFPEDQRKKIWTEKEREERKLFVEFINNLPGLEKIATNIPSFQIQDSNDHIFTQKKVLIVAGDLSVYQELKDKINFDLSKTGFIFLEDGIVNPKDLLKLPNDSAYLLTKNRSTSDINLTFQQDNLNGWDKITQSQWGIYKPGQFINSREELLKNNISSNDLDFGKGFVYSSQPGEKIQVKNYVKDSGQYYLTFRHLESSKSGILRIRLLNKENLFEQKDDSGFKWDFMGPFALSPGSYNITFENVSGFQAINTYGFIKADTLSQIGEGFAQKLFSRFQSFNLEKEADVQKLKRELNNNTSNIFYSQKNPTEYEINLTSDQNKNWLIFTDHYHPGWKLMGSRNEQSYPLYSMVNGFLINGDFSKGSKKMKLYFTPQDRVIEGIILSGASFLIIAIFCAIKIKRNEDKRAD